MDSNEARGSKDSVSKSTVVKIGAAAMAVALAAGIGTAVFLNRGDKPQNDGLTIGYAAEARVYLDEDSINAAMAEAMRNAADGRVSLRYLNDASSSDGIHFTCQIDNSSTNLYDMFITIYADSELTDRIFLSGLVPPGSGFDEIELEHALEPGDHTVYVALTQVKISEETGEQVIHNQVMHTMDFHVSQ